MHRKILIAPGPFKECLRADEVAAAIAAGVQLAEPTADIEMLPMCDGGSGFARRITEHASGRIVRTQARDPLGRQIDAEYGVIHHNGKKTAIIESAQTAGLALLDRKERDPRWTSTAGVGDLILHAIHEEGCMNVTIGCGDSATNDGGTGMIAALGATLLDIDGAELAQGGHALQNLASISLDCLDPKLAMTEFRVACNVTSILCGHDGTSLVYGPQKGATQTVARKLDDALTHYAAVVERQSGHDIRYIPGGGAAGGLGSAVYWLLDGSLHFSMNIVREFVALDRRLVDCDLVITGEGCIDRRTATGKVVAYIALAAKKFGKPVIALCGSAPEGSHASLFLGLDALYPIGSGPIGLDESMTQARNLLEIASFRALRSLSVLPSATRAKSWSI